MFTMESLRNQMKDLGGQIRTASQNLAAAALDQNVSMEDVHRQQDSLKAMQERMTALQAAYDAQVTEASGRAQPAQGNPAQERTLSDLRKSNEYARAFALAIRTGARPGQEMRDERLKPLYDALTIGGGSTPGEDGGFLVPEDIDNQIRELRRQMNPLASLFTEEVVGTNSGWRVLDTAPTRGLTLLSGEVPAGGIPRDDQPAFQKVTFALSTYGLIVPVSNELVADEVANLMGYLAGWFAKKTVIQENTLLLATLDTLTATAIAADEELTGIKTALNVALDPAIGMNAALLTNQSGFNALDTLIDETGRPLLQKDPVTGTPRLITGRPIHVASNAQLPNADTVAPLYIGDFRQYATLFRRAPMEMASTDVGGNAFTTYSTEVRGIVRMAVQKFDAAAAVKRTIVI